MVYKPGTDETKRVSVRADKFSKLFPGKICAISETERHT